MIDLYSDTVTRPTPKMKQAMLEAELGDEQRGEDPTTLRLERCLAERLGLEAATFLPSATMANAIAAQLFCGPGDEVLSAENGHMLNYEAGGIAVHARATPRAIPTWTGVFGANAVVARLRVETPHAPRPRLVVVENTTNAGGGRPWPLEDLDGVVAAARRHELKLHLDGSRIFNAAVALEQPVARLAGSFDTVTVCLSKGLGCAVGALLAHPLSRSGQVRRLKQLMGGAMRQSGLLAAAGIYALDHHLDRLREDHRRAGRLAEGLSELSQLVVEQVPVRTNMVYFEIPDRYDPEALEKGLRQENVRVSRINSRRFRAVTHLDIDDAMLEQALQAFQKVCARL